MRDLGRGRFSIDHWRRLAWFCLAGALLLPPSASAAVPSHLLIGPGAVGQGQTGTIKGRLIWGDENLPPVKVVVEQGKAPKDPDLCAKDEAILSRDLVIDPKTKGVAYAFAYLFRPKGDSSQQTKDLLAKLPEVVLDQKNCEFQPYALPFHKDQKLVIKSSDPKSHNVRFSGIVNTGINQMVAPQGEIKGTTLVAEKLPMELHCDIHSWMKGYLLVLDHPFFTTTATDGSFEIKDVPSGEQNLILWQNKVGYANKNLARGMPVTVKAGEVTDVGDITVDPVKAARAG
jgi:hypothetical protein